ncbi:MAG: hypothetical protein JNM89_17070 [Hyphomicrobiaceae bacterium]|nr:hypothetical protein [Hyphomicrobiaceae bacterium]
MTATETSFDTTDLPMVRRAALALAMHLLIEDERGLVLLRGATSADRANLEAKFWDCFDGDTREGVATLVRLWSLIDVFQARRLQDLLMARGFRVVQSAIKVAASSRLNLQWGFNPQRFVTALTREEAEVVVLPRAIPAMVPAREVAIAA